MIRSAVAVLVLGLALIALVAAGLHAQPPGSHGQLNVDETWRYVVATLAAGAVYAVAVGIVLRRAMPGWMTAAIVVIGIAARLLVLVAPPILSTDIYRYVWDGRVQAAGINPYLYIPADPALAPLRDPGTGPSDIYGNMNRVDTAPTIYPPAAQALFVLIGHVASSIWTVKAAMLAFDLMTMAAAMALLRVARRPPSWIVIWAWHPLVVWEFANGGHIDAASGAVACMALLAAVRIRPGWAGIALGVAVLFKLLPAALFPAIWRRWDWRAPLAAATVILLGYACYARAGLRVFGYLPGYAAEEGSKGFYAMQLLGLTGALSPTARLAYALGSLALLAGVAGFVALRAPFPADPVRRARIVCRGALLLSAAMLAVLSPHYPWYLAMLIPPAVVVPAWSALWPTLAAPLLYFGHDLVVVLPAMPLLALDIYLYRRRVAPPGLSEG